MAGGRGRVMVRPCLYLEDRRGVHRDREGPVLYPLTHEFGVAHLVPPTGAVASRRDLVRVGGRVGVALGARVGG